MDKGRDLAKLPKAHLHLHFTGSMRHETLLDLAGAHHVRLPDGLRNHWPPMLSGTDDRGWFRFQRLYDAARNVLRSESDVRRLVREAAEDEAAEGSGWLELQVDPSGYAARFGDMTSFLELVLDAAGEASRSTRVGIGLVVAANRTRHPLDARILARLAARYRDQGVVAFGLSNDERRGSTAEFARAFAIARRAGLPGVPHAGELRGADSVREVVETLGAQRLGHGVRSVEDPALLDAVVAAGIALEVCPASNVALGVYPDSGSVPLHRLLAAGAQVALGADDPLLFGRRLVSQYEIARDAHGFDDVEVAELARMSVRASFAPDRIRTRLLTGIDDWLAG